MKWAKILLLILLMGAVLSGCGKSGTYATQKNFITIGCVSPLTGEFALFGEGTLETEESAVAFINEKDGLYIDTLQRKLKVRFIVADSRSTEEGAQEAARQLITEENVDVVICSSGNLTVQAVADVCEQEQIPFFSVNAEAEAWLENGPYEYCFHCSYNNTSRLQALSDVWTEMGITSVGLLAVQSEEAEHFADTLDVFCKENGISCTRAGFINPASLDYSSAVQALASKEVEAVICFMDCNEFSDVWRQSGLKGLELQMCVLVNNHLFVRDITDIENGADIREFYTLTCWDKTYRSGRPDR